MSDHAHQRQICARTSNNLNPYDCKIRKLNRYNVNPTSNPHPLGHNVNEIFALNRRRTDAMLGLSRH